MMKKVILKLLENEIEEYWACKEERSKISTIIWNENNECDVLGEIVMRSADLHGILSSLNHDFIKDIETKINLLEKLSIYENKCIRTWIVKYSLMFPKYWRYLQSIENLRVIGLFCLKEEINRLFNSSHPSK